MIPAFQIMMVAIIEKSDLIEKVKQAIDEYSTCPTNENWERMIGGCHALILKDRIGDDIGEAIEFAEKMEKSNKVSSLLNPETLS